MIIIIISYNTTYLDIHTVTITGDPQVIFGVLRWSSTIWSAGATLSLPPCARPSGRPRRFLEAFKGDVETSRSVWHESR